MPGLPPTPAITRQKQVAGSSAPAPHFSRLSHFFLWLMFGVILFPASSLHGQARLEGIVQHLSPREVYQLENLPTFRLDNLRAISAMTEASQLELETRAVFGNGRFVHGSLRPGEESPARIYLQELARELEPFGLEFIGELKVLLESPTSLDRAPPEGARRDRSEIFVGEDRYTLHPIWPAGAMPSMVPARGLEGPLLYVGSGEWDELEGINLAGSIALMDFRGGRNWVRLFDLGVQAVIVLEDQFMIRDTAELHFTSTPIPAPRFFAPRELAQRLLRHAGGLSPAANQNLPVQDLPRALLRGGNRYQQYVGRSPFFYLPPTEPVIHEVLGSDLIRLLSAQLGVNAGELLLLNQLQAQDVVPGVELLIPGQDRVYRVREDELWRLLADLYGVTIPVLRSSNQDLPSMLAPGHSVLIPNVESPLVLLTHMDAVSFVPDLPHGGRMSLNLAVASKFLRHITRHPGAVRRKGVVIGFLEGDTLGGLTSRALAAHILQGQGRLSEFRDTGQQGRLERYRAGAIWFESPSAVLSETDAAWLGEEWLLPYLEAIRIKIAEERIVHVLATQELTNPDELAVSQEALSRTQEQLDLLLELRDRSLMQRRQAWSVRVQTYRNLLESAQFAPLLELHPLGVEQQASAYLRELAEAVLLEEIDRQNLKVAEAITARMNPGLDPWQVRPRLGFFLDLGFASPSIHFNTVNATRFRTAFATDGRIANTFGSRYQRIEALAGLRAGWTEEVSFLIAADSITLPMLPSIPPAAYPDFWTAAGVALLPMGGANDRYEFLDTPLDTPEHINFRHASVQARTALLLLQTALDNPPDSIAPSSLNTPRFGRLHGRTVEFNIRSGIDANEPVPNVFLYNNLITTTPAFGSNTNAYRGVRRALLTRSQSNGDYRLPLLNMNFTNRRLIQGYGLNEELGHFDRIVNQGQVGTSNQTNEYRLLEGTDSRKDLVMSRVHPIVVNTGVLPDAYGRIDGPNTSHVLRLQDAILDGPPRHFAIENCNSSFSENNLEVTILYLEPGRRGRFSVQEKMDFRLLLVGDTSVLPKGDGLFFGSPPSGERNVFLRHTTHQVARDMMRLTEQRMDIYERFGIRSALLEDARHRASAKLEIASSALYSADWRLFVGANREAWGILAKANPELLKLGRQAVFSVIVLMALLVPACFFLEKLLLGAKGIVGQLAGTTALFILGTIFLRLFHPAFSIAVSEFIVVISFIMILMSVIVLVICYQRFEVLMRRARQKGGEIEDEGISVISSLGTALSLGVSNLKKRPSRTLLTSMTVSVLSFSIIAFVSFTGRDVVSIQPVELDADVEGILVEAEPPAYEGVLFREFNWRELSLMKESALRTEFGGVFQMTARGHYLEVEGGNNADREGINQIDLRFGDRRHIITGIMIFEPAEVDFTGLHTAVSRQSWFRGPQRREDGTFLPAERNVVILPDSAAEALGLTEDMIFTASGERRKEEDLPRVFMRGVEWKVIGILDTERANRIRDINGKSLALVDFLRSAMSPATTTGRIINESRSYHMDWNRLALVPRAASADVDGRVRSVALRFNEDTDHREFFGDLALRLDAVLFAHSEGNIGVLNFRKQHDVGGLGKIIVPVILCILIVLNTMLGNVEERKGEVGMLGAIGLSPRQISFLLLSESAVFSVIGIILGTFLGLFFANLIPWLNERDIAFLTELSFNFTSLASLALAMATGLVVLVATLVPASRAAALAAPSGMARWILPQPEGNRIHFELPFTLTRANSVGMLVFFEQFLNNHTEPTSADFNCRDIRLEYSRNGGAPSLTIRASIWLAPYDLDVSQQFLMSISPEEGGNVFQVAIDLHRSSGSEESWIRTNYSFMDLVRQQFLLWRNLQPEARTAYINQGREWLQNEPAHV